MFRKITKLVSRDLAADVVIVMAIRIVHGKVIWFMIRMVI